MNQKAYKALEYYKIINMLTDKASSSMGKEICRKLEPSTDIDEIRHMQTQTRDALTRLFQKGNISFLEKTGKCISGLSLHMSDFINICGWLQLPADFFSHGRGSLVCQHIDDFIIFKCFICFLIHCLFKSPDRYLYNLLSLIL